MKDLKFVVCEECFNVKAVLGNTFGNTIYCAVCKKETRCYHPLNAEFNLSTDEKAILRWNMENPR